jgi:hypothetical protein
MTLTGKLRHRVKTGWFGSHQLILQVEVKEMRASRTAPEFSHEEFLYWQDATFENLQQLNILDYYSLYKGPKA